MPQEVLVVSDHNQLEISLLLPDPDNFMQRLCQRPDIITVKISSGLIERDQTAVNTEALGQSQTDDYTSQDLRPALQRPRMSISASCLTMQTR